MLAADADGPNPTKRVPPSEEFLTHRLAPAPKVVVEDER
jgi:hypothetical protein